MSKVSEITKELKDQFNITETKRAIKDLKKARKLVMELSQFTNRIQTKRRLTLNCLRYKNTRESI